MIRTLVCVAASLLMVGVLYAEDKKPEAKTDVVKEKSPDAPKKEGKDAPEAGKKVAPEGKAGVKKEGARPEGGSLKGRLTKISVESGVVTLSVDGKDYEFATSDNTFVALRTADRDGKQVVLGVQLMNADQGVKGGGEKKEAVKKEQPKNPGDKPTEKPEAPKK